MSQVGVFSDNSSGAIDIVTITGNTGGAVSPDASGNINVIGSGTVTVTGTPIDNTLTVSVAAGGGLSLSTFGSTPNANGLSLAAGVLNMQPADATNPGGVSTAKQSFAAVKTAGIAPRSVSATSASSLTPNSDNTDMYIYTALAAGITINADSGSPVNGQKLVFKFLDNASPQTITWASGSAGTYQAIGITLPTTTTASKILYVGFIYNANASRWDGVATVVQA